MKKIIIIGNGIDVRHGILSKYKDFKEYLNKIDKEKVSILEDVYNPKNLWSDFEDALGKPDQNFLKQLNLLFGHEYVPNFLGDVFYRWALQLNSQIKKEKREEKLLELFKQSYVITFNYTQTLEYLYNIKDENILYLHGVATHFNELFPIVVGHNAPYKAGEEKAITFFRKDKTGPLNNLKEFLKGKIKDIDKIEILGFSYNDVDFEYFEFIKSLINSQIKWCLGYHTEEDKNRLFKYVSALELKEIEIKEF